MLQLKVRLMQNHMKMKTVSSTKMSLNKIYTLLLYFTVNLMNAFKLLQLDSVLDHK